METDLLVFLNVAVYIAAGVGGVMLLRRPPRAKTGGIEALSGALRTRFPDLPQGFTLREGIDRARVAEPALDWAAIDHALDSYEGHRYGEQPGSDPTPPEVLELVDALRRSGR